MFIGREQELQFLEDKYRAKGGQLVILYGRRRVGKTETLREFCKGKRRVFFSCREEPNRTQLRNFSEKLLRENIPASKYVREFSDWETAFRSVADLPYENAKKLLIVDEFPYMCKDDASLPSILQNLWDETLKNENVMIVLCGSAMSFIEKELLAEKNPLYGRTTGVFKMEPMSFRDAARFFPNYSDQDKLLAYAILGGVPHYLAQFDPDLSLEENVKKNALSKGCALYSEPEFLLKQELRETSLYNAIVEAVALGGSKLNEISVKSLVDDVSKTSVYLKRLIELNIVKREFSVDDGLKKSANARAGFYRLNDNFFRFWYSFVFPNYSDLESGDADGVFEYEIKPNLRKFASFAFEDACREHVAALRRANKTPFRYQRMGTWRGKTTTRGNNARGEQETEIDLLATSPKADKYLVGECKFKEKPFSYSEYLDVGAKTTPWCENADIYYYLFSASGFDKKLVAESKKDDKLRLIGLEEIVRGA